MKSLKDGKISSTRVVIESFPPFINWFAKFNTLSANTPKSTITKSIIASANTFNTLPIIAMVSAP